MTDMPKTLQDVIRRRQQAVFVGREEELEGFRRNLRLPPEHHLRRILFNIHGDAGVGKTLLVQQFRLIAEDLGILNAYLDESTYDAPGVMNAISTEFSRRGTTLKDFDDRYRLYRERRHEVESDPRAPEGLPAFLTKTAVRAGLQAANSLPVLGMMTHAVDENALAEQAERLREYIVGKFKSSDDLALVVSPTETLTPIFVKELFTLGKQQPIALFFDTFERTAFSLERWLIELIEGRYGDLPMSLTLTIAGQNPLDPNRWAAYGPVLASLSLDPFTEAEARHLLASKGVTSERVVEVILQLSGRLPVLVDMLANGRPDTPEAVGDPSGSAVERFLKWEPDEGRRNDAIAVAQARYFNEDTLTELTSRERSAQLLTWLRSLPFVSEHHYGYQYHQTIRSNMTRLQRRWSPERWRWQHQQLARHYEDRCDKLGLSGIEAWKDRSWRDCRLEATYHRLCTDPAQHLPSALDDVLSAYQEGPIAARRWSEMLMGAGADSEVDTVLAWGDRLLKCSSGSDEDRIAFLTALIEDGSLEQNRQATALRFRATRHRNLKHYTSALADGNQAVALSPGSARALSSRAETLRLAKRYNDALADFDRALELDPDYSWAIVGRGRTYRAVNDNSKALADFDRAVELEPASTWARGARIRALWEMRRYNQALDDLNAQLEANASNTWALYHRGETYRRMNELEKALADFDHAVALDPQDSWPIMGRGRTYVLRSEFEKGVMEFDRAVALDPEDAWAILGRGRTYEITGDYVKALADFDRALELDPSNDSAKDERIHVFWKMQRFDKALDDLDRDLAQDPTNASALFHRADTYRRMREYDKALREYDRLVELQGEEAGAIRGRAGVRSDMGNYREAVAEFDHAIELDPFDDRGYSGRGRAHLRSAAFEAALADFNYALELDPADGFNYSMRAELYRAIGQYERALADLDLAIRLDPAESVHLYRRAELYRWHGRYDDALADLGRAEELAPDKLWLAPMINDLLCLLGRPNEVLARVNALVEVHPESIEAFIGRGTAHRMMRHYEEEIGGLTQGIELNGRDPWLFARRAEARLLTGMYDEGLADVEEALGIDRSQDWFHYDRALLKIAHGQMEEAEGSLALAMETCREGLARAPDSPALVFNEAVYSIAEHDELTARSLLERLATMTAEISYPSRIPIIRIEEIIELHRTVTGQAWADEVMAVLAKLYEMHPEAKFRARRRDR